MLGSLHMGWRDVLFANWPADPAVVRAHVPGALTLDTFDGTAWLSVVPFRNVDVRPTWLPAGWGFGLPELNLRTYVVRDGEPGVYFFNLDADGLLGVLGGRWFHHLPYYNADIDLSRRAGEIRFESVRTHPGARPVRFRATYGPDGEEYLAEPGTLDAFLVERYRYYTEARRGGVRHADVAHDPWPLHSASVSIRTNTLFEANGFAPPETSPVYRYSPGVDTVASSSRP